MATSKWTRKTIGEDGEIPCPLCLDGHLLAGYQRWEYATALFFPGDTFIDQADDWTNGDTTDSCLYCGSCGHQFDESEIIAWYRECATREEEGEETS